jgi:hypothetical protein
MVSTALALTRSAPALRRILSNDALDSSGMASMLRFQADRAFGPVFRVCLGILFVGPFFSFISSHFFLFFFSLLS